MYIPNIEVRRLNNGLKIVLLLSKEINTVYVDSRILFGSGHVAMPGMAHFIEHLVQFGGTKEYSPENIRKRIADCSLKTNGLTSYLFTKYSGSSPVTGYKELFEIFQQRLFYAQFSEEVYEREKTRIQEEIIERKNDNFINFFDLLFENQALQKNSALNCPIGQIKDLDRISLSKTISIYERFYHPANILLMVSAPVFMKEEIIAEIEKLFDINVGRSQQAASLKPVTLKEGSRKIIRDNNFGNRYFGFVFPQNKTKDSDLQKAKFIYQQLLSADSVLQEIRDVFGIYCIEPDYFCLPDSLFVFIYGYAGEEDKILEIEKCLNQKITNNSFAPSFLDIVKEKQINNMLIDFESDVQLLDMIGDHYCRTQEVETPAEMLEKIRNLDMRSLQSFVRNIFQIKRMNVLIVGPN
ncbi:MAG: pitrilysin family protein [Patescibacteria group bacterium]|nr:pitrilysin family protein [Patescibacteria group bacterium]